jgi:hypothetical protein
MLRWLSSDELVVEDDNCSREDGMVLARLFLLASPSLILSYTLNLKHATLAR